MQCPHGIFTEYQSDHANLVAPFNGRVIRADPTITMKIVERTSILLECFGMLASGGRGWDIPRESPFIFYRGVDPA